MNESSFVKCVACAEEIKSDAILCRFCQTRQDDPNFTRKTFDPELDWDAREANLSKSRPTNAWALVGFIVGAVLALVSVAYFGLSSSRATTASEIESAVAAQVEKLSALGLMGTLEKVKCDPQGLSIAFPETTYKCFASDADGKGLVFKATMNWGTGVFQYGLDRGN